MDPVQVLGQCGGIKEEEGNAPGMLRERCWHGSPKVPVLSAFSHRLQYAEILEVEGRERGAHEKSL